jgi:hypothetical protein
MPKVAFHADLKATPEAAEIKTHNRWHPDPSYGGNLQAGRGIPGRML